MMNLAVEKLTKYAVENSDGVKVFNQLLPAFKAGEVVTLDFENIDIVTPSFVNTALVPLLEWFEFEQIKKQIRVVNTNRHVLEIIRNRLEFESKRIKPHKSLA